MENKNIDIESLPYCMDDIKEVMNEASTVYLTEQEIIRGKRNKKEMQKKAKSFVNAPIYRTFHSGMKEMISIIRLMDRKQVKVSDVMLQKMSDSLQWTASAYEQRNPSFKLYSLNEAISLMYTVKVCVNSLTSLNLIGKHKSTTLSKTLDNILHQQVAWRGSIIDEGGYDE